MDSSGQIKFFSALSIVFFLILAGCGGSGHNSTYIISDTMGKQLRLRRLGKSLNAER